MQGILDATQERLPSKRLNSLDILEEIHKYRYQLKEPFVSFEPLLDAKPGGFAYQALLKISSELDTPVSYDQPTTKKQRKKHLGRLRLILDDGGAEAFHAHSRSVHLAVLLSGKEMLIKLLDNGQNSDEQWSTSGWTALHLAAEENQFDCVHVHLDALANAKLKNKHELTPLHYAPKGDDRRIEELLSFRRRIEDVFQVAKHAIEMPSSRETNKQGELLLAPMRELIKSHELIIAASTTNSELSQDETETRSHPN